MGCDFPVKCKYWDEKENKCVFDFEKWDGKGIFPCEAHQMIIDRHAIREIESALIRGDYDTARSILNSPFVSFRR